MRNDLALSALRDVVTPLLAPPVQEVSFVTNPIHLVTARIGTKVVGSWLRFSGAMEFEDPTRRDKRITRTPGYSLDVTPWVTGNERMDLLPY